MVFYIICIALACITTLTNFWHLIMYLLQKRWRNITYLLNYLLTHDKQAISHFILEARQRNSAKRNCQLSRLNRGQDLTDHSIEYS